MSRFTNDADNVQLALEQSVVSLCSSCLMFVGIVAMMLFINWKLFIVTALILVFTMLIFRSWAGAAAASTSSSRPPWATSTATFRR